MSSLAVIAHAEPLSWEQLGMTDAPCYRAQLRIAENEIISLTDMPEICEEYIRLHPANDQTDTSQLFIVGPMDVSRARVWINPRSAPTATEYEALTKALSIYASVYSRLKYEADPENAGYLRSTELVRMISPDTAIDHIKKPDGQVCFLPRGRLVCQEVSDPASIWFPKPHAFFNRYEPV